MKKMIIEKLKKLYAGRKRLWKKYQAAVWIEVIFIGIAAVSSVYLMQIEQANQVAAARKVMEEIQSEVYHAAADGGTLNEVRGLVTERMEELERENGHNIYGIALQFYDQKGKAGEYTGNAGLYLVWRTSTEDGIRTEDFVLEDYFEQGELETFFYNYYQPEGSQTARSCGIRRMTGYYGEDGDFLPLEVIFYDAADADDVYVLQNEKKMKQISDEELVYRLGDLEQEEISRPDQTEMGYFSMAAFDQTGGYLYSLAANGIGSVMSAGIGESGFEWSENRGNVSICRRIITDNDQIGGYSCSIYADIQTMIRDEGNLERMLCQVWGIGQCFAAFLIGVSIYIRKKKSRLEEMHNTFMNAITHEMKTPAAVLKNTAECLNAGIQPEKQEHYLAIIEQEADHMNELLTSMLTYTRVTDSFYEIRKEECSLEQLTREISRHYADAMEKKRISLIWDINNPAMVRCDRKLMEMVLDNLISNAVKFSLEGGVIRISLTARSISIYNEGKPIPEGKMEHIWEPMYRSDESRAYKEGSSGMGLAISGAVLKLHGADYGVRNVSDGVEFYIHM